MKKIAALCIAALGAALLVLGTAPGASAYPDLTCHVDVHPQVLKPGQTFTAVGTAAAVDKNNQAVPESELKWTFRWNGTTKHRTGSPVSATFTAPHVTKTRHIPLTTRVDTPLGPCVHHFDITVLAAATSGPGGGLPGTGGPAFWLLVAGLALMLGGGSAVAVARKRH